jgi:ABC-type multidrug transport system fused ATPase/permease subunit
MNAMIGLRTQIGAGLAAGAAMVAVDNFAFEGEASPIVIVAMLFAATASAVVMWSWRGCVAAAAAWACVPLAHLVKHFFGLPDTLHPNTYTSILMLAAFTLAIAAIGAVCGALVRILVNHVTGRGARRV